MTKYRPVHEMRVRGMAAAIGEGAYDEACERLGAQLDQQAPASVRGPLELDILFDWWCERRRR